MAALVPGQLPNLFSGLLPIPHHTQDTESSTRSAGLTTSGIVILTSPTSSAISIISPSQTSSTTITLSSESLTTPSGPPSVIPSPTSETSSVIPTPTLTPIETTSDGSTFYVTITSSTFPSPGIQTAPANTSNGFLQNKVLSGIVFAVVGAVALVLVVAIAIIALRRSQKKRLHDEAVNFDPGFLESRPNRNSLEKRRFSILSSDEGHNGRGGRFSPSARPVAAHTPQDPWYYSGSESQHTMIGLSQHSWHRGGATDGPHITVQVPQSELRPAWAYGGDTASLPYPGSQDAHPTR